MRPLKKMHNFSKNMMNKNNFTLFVPKSRHFVRRVKKFFEKFVKKFKLFERSEFLNFRILRKILAQAQTVLIFASLFIKKKRQ